MDYFSSGSAQEQREPTEAWRGDLHFPDWPKEQAGAEYNLYSKDLDAFLMKKPLQHEEIVRMLLEHMREMERAKKEIDDAIDDLLNNL